MAITAIEGAPGAGMILCSSVVDTSIGPMEWLVLSLWVLALCFLANIVFHWVYVPLVNRIADWWLDREEAKAGKQ